MTSEDHTGPDETPDELLDWLCWMWALDGDRFYPPKETAAECAEHNKGADETGLAWEEGYHARAYSEAVERFDDLEVRGFDPRKRTERYIERAEERGDNLDPIDWEWLDRKKTGPE